jgi:hypothetical protein
MLGDVSSHILGLMEEGRFGKDRILLNFFSPDGATRGDRRRRRRLDSEPTVTIFAHTLLHQLISSTTASGEARISIASDFLNHLLDTIDSPELLTRFKNISGADPLVVIQKLLDIPGRKHCDALINVLKGKKDLGIVVMLDSVREGKSDFITAVATLVGRLSKETTGLKALLTNGPVDDSRMTLGGRFCIKIQYDKERRGWLHYSLIMR